MSLHTFVFAGPSAVGKTYTADLLMRLYPDKFEQAKVYTTRTPRTNEVASDRIFVSSEEFEKLAHAGKFLIHDDFGGNRYGFDRSSLYPGDKHLLVNTWLSPLPQFSSIPHIIIVGMQAPNDWQKILVPRMKSRGDSPETIEKRLQLISKDNSDLQKNMTLVNQHGKLFTIRDDKTIPDEIVPWLEQFIY